MIKKYDKNAAIKRAMTILIEEYSNFENSGYSTVMFNVPHIVAAQTNAHKQFVLSLLYKITVKNDLDELVWLLNQDVYKNLYWFTDKANVYCTNDFDLYFSCFGSMRNYYISLIE